MPVLTSKAWANFVRGSYPSRALAQGLTFLAVAPILHQLDAPWWQWLLYALHAFVWPYAAWRLSARAGQPTQANRRNLLIDHFAKTSPWGLLVMMGFGIAAGMRNLMRAAKQLTDEAQKAAEKPESTNETS